MSEALTNSHHGSSIGQLVDVRVCKARLWRLVSSVLYNPGMVPVRVLTRR